MGLLAWLAIALLLSPAAEAKRSLSDKVWVIIRPKQCLGNPWEKDWLAKHHNQTVKYPIRQEGSIIKSFFASKQIPIYEMREVKYIKGDPLCQACDCPRGDTFYLMIQASDAPKMVKFGYTERLPANEVPPKNDKK